MKSNQPKFPFRVFALAFAFLFQLFVIAPFFVANAAPAEAIAVDTLTDENASNVFCSLREAIIAANTICVLFSFTLRRGANPIVWRFRPQCIASHQRFRK